MEKPSWWERFCRATGTWPVLGRATFLYYAWARREISPKHPDAPLVGQRYARLRAEFAR